MMLPLAIVLLLQTAAPAADQPAATQPAPSVAPAKEVIDRAQGPMRAELMAMQETRRWFMEPPQGAPTTSDLAFQLRIVGDKMLDIVRIGRPMFTSVIDETGKELVKPDAYTEEQKAETFRTRGTPEQIRENGLLMSGRVEAATRGAKMLKSVRGTVKALMASTSEEIPIKNVLQTRGKNVENARLAELGIVVTVLPPGNPANMASTPGMVAIEYTGKADLVKEAAFFDGWMTRIRTSARNAATNDGKPCFVYQLPEDKLNDDLQIVITVWPELKESPIAIEWTDVALP